MEPAPASVRPAAPVGGRLPGQVVHLLLGPQTDDLAWVQFAEAVDEAVVVFDVAVSVLELVERRLVDLQHHFVWNGLLLQADAHTQNMFV